MNPVHRLFVERVGRRGWRRRIWQAQCSCGFCAPRRGWYWKAVHDADFHLSEVAAARFRNTEGERDG